MSFFDDDTPIHHVNKPRVYEQTTPKPLTVTPLKDVKLGEEIAYLLASARYSVSQVTLMLQEAEAGRLYAEEEGASTLPISPNQVASAVNSLNAVIKQIFNMKAEVLNMERIKKLEEMVLECMETLPIEARQPFFEKYKTLPQE